MRCDAVRWKMTGSMDDFEDSLTTVDKTMTILETRQKDAMAGTSLQNGRYVLAKHVPALS
jgi:hypothetical protein